MKTLGVIGCGVMGGALLRGWIEEKVPEYQFCAYTRTPKRLEPLESIGVKRMENAREVAHHSDIIVLGVKPYQILDVLNEIRSELKKESVVVSIAAGVTLSALHEEVLARCQLVRCMPNTPAVVGKGIFAFSFAECCTNNTRGMVLQLFSALGYCLEITEKQFSAFSALIGAGPAYVFQIMQALVQAGVTLGFGHREARELVCELLEGSAVMAKQRGEHLMAMRDAVLSPNGLSIAGVNVLDQRGLTGTLVDAVLAADARGRQMENR